MSKPSLCSMRVLLALAVAAAGCAAADHGLRSPADVDGAMRAYMDSYYEAELPPPPPDEDLELLGLRNQRQNVAVEMTAAAAAALAPMGLAVSFFVPDGPVDFFLDIVPFHKLGDLYHIGRRAVAGHRQGKNIKRLVKKFDGLLGKEDRSFILALAAMRKADFDALRALHKHTRSEAAIRALTRSHVRGRADPKWILDRLERARDKLDGTFVQRFTFDADFVAEFSAHSASPSWDTLRKVVEGAQVPPGLRASLASKVKGLMGERVAARMLGEPRLLHKYLGNGNARVQTWRGVRYQRGSVDIVLHSNKDNKALIAEVKTWSADMWKNQSKRKEVLEHLDRHDGGVDEILEGAEVPYAEVKGKILFVEESGFRGGMNSRARKEFEDAVEERGWAIEFFPGDRVTTFAELIDSLR